MAAILFSRLCGRNTASLVVGVRRPPSLLCGVSSKGLQRVVVSSAVHSSADRKQHLEIAPSQPSTHWKFERYVSVALLTLIPTGIVYPSAPVDWALAVVIPLHNHWGVGQVLTDYIHGSTMPKIAKGSWLALSIVQFIGLCYFNYADVGLCQAVNMLWHM